MRRDSVARAPQSLSGSLKRLLIEIREQHGLTETLSASDRETYAASPNHYNNVVGHLTSPWVGANRAKPAFERPARVKVLVA
jgi:hypothetical protein